MSGPGPGRSTIKVEVRLLRRAANDPELPIFARKVAAILLAHRQDIEGGADLHGLHVARIDELERRLALLAPTTAFVFGPPAGGK